MSERFRDFLKGWLDEKGWSYYELGVAADIGQSIIARWLLDDPVGRTIPSAANLEKLAPVVGKTTDELQEMLTT